MTRGGRYEERENRTRKCLLLISGWCFSLGSFCNEWKILKPYQLYEDLLQEDNFQWSMPIQTAFTSLPCCGLFYLHGLFFKK